MKVRGVLTDEKRPNGASELAARGGRQYKLCRLSVVGSLGNCLVVVVWVRALVLVVVSGLQALEIVSYLL